MALMDDPVAAMQPVLISDPESPPGSHFPPYTPEPGHFLFTSESVGEGHPGRQRRLVGVDGRL